MKTSAELRAELKDEEDEVDEADTSLMSLMIDEETGQIERIRTPGAPLLSVIHPHTRKHTHVHGWRAQL